MPPTTMQSFSRTLLPQLLLLMMASIATASAITELLAPGADDGLTDAEVARLRAALREIIMSRTARDEFGLPFRPLVAAFVRLAFQACLGGQCTGCVHVADDGIAGGAHLNSTVGLLADLRQRVGVRASYGDLFALAGLVALNVGEEIAAERRGAGDLRNFTHGIRFRQGRSDCPTAPYAAAGGRVEFPSSGGGLEHVISWFLLGFGFGAEQTVAIMGLHKLGGLKRHPHTLDLFAQWSFAPDALDNGYYQDLVRVDDWQPRYVRLPSGSSQQPQQQPPLQQQQLQPPSLSSQTQRHWRQAAATAGETYLMWRRQRSDTALMFNCDIALYKNVSFTLRGYRVATACSYESCPLSKTSLLVLAFARDNDLWLRSMSAAFAAMIEKGL